MVGGGVAALQYKSEGCGFDSLHDWCQWVLLNPSGCTMALRSTQPLTDMSTGIVSGGYRRPMPETDKGYRRPIPETVKGYRRPIPETDKGYGRPIFETDKRYKRPIPETDKEYRRPIPETVEG